jgi:pyruvate dehydrogenase E1 component alpha subunit
LKRQPADNIHDRVASFGVKTFALFGNDVVRVKSVLADAFKHARSGEGPVFVEAYTYRRFAHVGPEDDDYIGYRPDEERAFWQKNCPIKLFEVELVKCEILNYSLKQKILIEIEKEIEAAFDYAKKSPFPDDTDWESQNYEEKTPFADKLLKDGKKLSRFDQYQEDTRLEPY